MQGGLAVWISRPWVTNDSVVYLGLASSLAHEGAYGAMTAEGFLPDVLRPPGYPIILWILHHVLALPLWAISIIQVGLLWICLLLAQRMLERFGIEPSPMLALAAVYPFPAVYSADIMTEAWATLAVTGIAALLVLGDRRRAHWFVSGLIAGFAILLRADMLLLPLLLAGLAIWQTLGERKSSQFISAVLPLLGSLLILSPYMAWNAAHFGQAKPVPLAGALGNSLHLATWQPVLPLADLDALYDGQVTARAEAAGLADEVRAMNRSIGAPELTAPWNPVSYPTQQTKIEITKRTRHPAVQRILNDPQTYARHVIVNTWRLWNTGVYPAGIPTYALMILILVSWLVMLFGLAGVLLTIIKPVGWMVPRILASIFLYVPGIHLFLHTEARYTAPVRVLLLLFAGAVLCYLFERYFLSRSSISAQKIGYTR